MLPCKPSKKMSSPPKVVSATKETVQIGLDVAPHLPMVAGIADLVCFLIVGDGLKTLCPRREMHTKQGVEKRYLFQAG